MSDTNFDFGISDWDEFLGNINNWTIDTESPYTPKKTRIGYNINREGIHGLILLNQAQLGKNLVMRLKDNGDNLKEEVIFWAMQLVDMLKANEMTSFDLVSNPPSSGKSSYHLATVLAQFIAKELKIIYQDLFRNNAPRGYRAALQTKLQETKDYIYLKTPNSSKILVIDDAIHTRRTARECLDVAYGDHLFWCFLYGN